MRGPSKQHRKRPSIFANTRISSPNRVQLAKILRWRRRYVFALIFVSIHPFNDGNGHMSRLLTLLLMYRSGYDVGKYVSVEKEIERTKETYYEALAASSQGWREGKGDYAPFVTYMLGIIDACYRELANRFSLADAPSGNEGGRPRVLRPADRLGHKAGDHGRQPWNEPAHAGAHPLKTAAGRSDREDRRRAIDRISAVPRRYKARKAPITEDGDIRPLTYKS